MRRHDLKAAAREHGIIDALGEAGLKADADKAYQGAPGTSANRITAIVEAVLALHLAAASG